MHTVITTAHQTVHNSLCCDSSTGLAVWPYPEETTYGTLNPDTSAIFMLHFSDLNKKVEKKREKRGNRINIFRRRKQWVSVSLANSNIRVQTSMVQNINFFRNWGKYKLKHGEQLVEPYIILHCTHWLQIIKTKFQQLGAYINYSYLHTEDLILLITDFRFTCLLI